jgi:hypothetical protein
VALLAELDAELEQASEERGGEPLEFSAAERATMALIADAVDRRVDLYADYRQADDAKLRMKLSGELRLLEASIARLLKGIRTDLPPEPSRISQKAKNAVNARWERERAKG